MNTLIPVRLLSLPQAFAQFLIKYPLQKRKINSDENWDIEAQVDIVPLMAKGKSNFKYKRITEHDNQKISW